MPTGTSARAFCVSCGCAAKKASICRAPEAERLILWAVVERGRALSSLTTEDAVAFRAFLPFTGGLSARSVAYALSVVGAMFRWLIQQRYLLANPFAGIKGCAAHRAPSPGPSHACSGKANGR